MKNFKLNQEILDKYEILNSDADKALAVYDASLQMTRAELGKDKDQAEAAMSVLKNAADMGDNCPFSDDFLEMQMATVEDASNRIVATIGNVLNQQAAMYKKHNNK